MLLPHIAKPELFPEKQNDDFQIPKLSPVNHHTQFAEACRGFGKPTASFDYSGPLTEAVLLGSVAVRFPQTKLEWNASQCKFNNAAEASPYLHRNYRKGWEVKELS